MLIVIQSVFYKVQHRSYTRRSLVVMVFCVKKVQDHLVNVLAFVFSGQQY